MARALKEAFEGTAVVLTPDLPLHPKKALNEIRSIIDKGLQSWKPCSSTIATHIIRIVCGDFLVSRTPWLTSPLYSWSITFPGGHTPTEQEIKTWYAPLAQKMLMEFSVNF